MVKNPTCNAGDVGSILGWVTEIPHAMEQLSPQTTTSESVFCNERSCMLELRPDAAKERKTFCCSYSQSWGPLPVSLVQGSSTDGWRASQP